MPKKLPSRHRRSISASDLVGQLESLLKQLRGSHPNLLGIGLGYRRRRGRLVPETVVKFQVDRKVRKVTKDVRLLPKRVKLRTLALGQVVTIDVPTDVETPRRMSPTASVGGMTVAALARWVAADGGECSGVITAAHGLRESQIDVELADGSKASGQVLVRSSPADGYDIGLVRLEVPLDRLSNIGPSSPPLADANTLLSMLSSDPNDALSVKAETWSSTTSKPIWALAFFVEWRWQGFEHPMKHVVQCDGGPNVFEPGSSGSVWVTRGAHPWVLALQSHGHEPDFRLAEGTHFQSGFEWLSARPEVNELRVAWRVEDLHD